MQPHESENPPAVENADGLSNVDLEIALELAPAAPAGKADPGYAAWGSETDRRRAALALLAERLFDGRRL